MSIYPQVLESSAALPTQAGIHTVPRVPTKVASTSQSSAAGSGPEERRPKRGDDDYVPRPSNAWMLFRSHNCKILAEDPDGKKQHQVNLNKILSQQWKELSSEERARWEALAEEKKLEHKTRYPKYRYRPRPRHSGGASAPTSPLSQAGGMASLQSPMPLDFTTSHSGASDQYTPPLAHTWSAPPHTRALVGVASLQSPMPPDLTTSHSGASDQYTPPLAHPWSAPPHTRAFFANAHPVGGPLREGHWNEPADSEGAASRSPLHPASQNANDLEASLQSGASYHYTPLAHPIPALSRYTPISTIQHFPAMPAAGYGHREQPIFGVASSLSAPAYADAFVTSPQFPENGGPPQADAYWNGFAEGTASRRPSHSASQIANDFELPMPPNSSTAHSRASYKYTPPLAHPVPSRYTTCHHFRNPASPATSAAGYDHRGRIAAGADPLVSAPLSAPAHTCAFVTIPGGGGPPQRDGYGNGASYQYTAPLAHPLRAPAHAGAFAANEHPGYWNGPADPEAEASHPGQIANNSEASLRSHSGASYQHTLPLAHPVPSRYTPSSTRQHFPEPASCPAMSAAGYDHRGRIADPRVPASLSAPAHAGAFVTGAHPSFSGDGGAPQQNGWPAEYSGEPNMS